MSKKTNPIIEKNCIQNHIRTRNRRYVLYTHVSYLVYTRGIGADKIRSHAPAQSIKTVIDLSISSRLRYEMGNSLTACERSNSALVGMCGDGIRASVASGWSFRTSF